MSSILRRLGVLPNPALAGFVPRIMNGVVEIPVYAWFHSDFPFSNSANRWVSISTHAGNLTLSLFFHNSVHFRMCRYHMRGGTSTGCVVWHEHLPSELDLKEEAIRWIMGVPQQGDVKGNNQITGLGRGVATSNKVFQCAEFLDCRSAYVTFQNVIALYSWTQLFSLIHMAVLHPGAGRRSASRVE